MCCSNEKWINQIEDMHREEEVMYYIRNNMTYPRGLINLVSNPIFFTFDKNRKAGAVRHGLASCKDVYPDTIIYNSIREVVYFWNKQNLHHKFNLKTQRVEVLNMKS